MKFWQAVATATLAADFARTNARDYSIGWHIAADAFDIVIVALMWAAMRWALSDTKSAATSAPAAPHRTHSHYGQTDNIASRSVDIAGGKAPQ